MEREVIEFPFWPCRHVLNCIPDCNYRQLALVTMSRFRELILNPKIISDTNDEYSSTLLGNSELCCVQHIRFDVVASLAKYPQLILKQVPKIFAYHSRYIFYNKGFGSYLY